MPTQLEIIDSSILYIEDDDITRTQLSQFLKSQCKVLYTAADGQEGLTLFKQFEPDIVITDIEMPVLNGLEMAKEIRKTSLSTQIIIITAYTKPEYLLEAVNLQLIQYLVKPISLKKITQALKLASCSLNKEKSKPQKMMSEEIYYDTCTKQLMSKNKIVNLSKYERALIELLIAKYPASVSYESIDERIYEYRGNKNATKLLVRSLRGKIKKQSIINVPGYGYKLNFMDDQ
jgi:YesN/AraC family two-component response regulator